MIRFIWAEDEEGNIGYQGKLPWHLLADLKHFKDLTLNHPIVMGRKTFASFPGLLPKRQHIILSTSPDLVRKYQDNEKVKVFARIDQLRSWIKNHADQTIDVIGGASLFEELSEDVDILEKTVIHHTFSGDVKMPELAYDNFSLVKREEHFADEKNKYDYDFLELKRK